MHLTKYQAKTNFEVENASVSVSASGCLGGYAQLSNGSAISKPRAIIHTEFFRTAFLPTAIAVLTGTSGVLGGVPAMWVIMATALAFGGAIQALLRGDELRERKKPIK